jgi:cytochrome b
MPPLKKDRVFVWGPAVWVFHWALAASFFLAYFTEEDLLLWHVWAGYVVGGLIVFRVLWGFVGPKHARFGDFLCSPNLVFAYLLDLLAFRPRRYLGHSPAGGAMVIALLLGLAASVLSGLVVFGADQKAGPLAGFFAASLEPPPMPMISVLSVGPAQAEDKDEQTEREEARKEGEDNEAESPFIEAMEELHEFLSNLMLALVIVHIGGVVLASFAHRENLIAAMISGYKRRL